MRLGALPVAAFGRSSSLRLLGVVRQVAGVAPRTRRPRAILTVTLGDPVLCALELLLLLRQARFLRRAPRLLRRHLFGRRWRQLRRGKGRREQRGSAK